MADTLKDSEPNYTEILSQFKNRDEHKTPLDKLIRKLETDTTNGLTSKQAETKLKEHGRNIFRKKSKLWVVALVQEASALYQIFFAIGFTTYFCYILRPETPQPLHTAVMLVGTALLLTVYTFFKYGGESFVGEKYSPPTARCIRDGKKHQISASELVPGDIIEVNMGERFGADARIISSSNAEVSYNGILENDQVISVSPDARPSENYWESQNMILRGGVSLIGTIRAVVVATGESTVIGKLIKSVADSSYIGKSNLRKMNRLFNLVFLIEIGFGFAYLIAHKTPAKIIRP